MAEVVRVHLARPGGQREGPYTVAEINRALAKGQYELSDYWAWHEGLPEWVPLYAIEGIVKGAAGARELPKQEEKHEVRSINDGPADEAPDERNGGTPLLVRSEVQSSEAVLQETSTGSPALAVESDGTEAELIQAESVTVEPERESAKVPSSEVTVSEVEEETTKETPQEEVSNESAVESAKNSAPETTTEPILRPERSLLAQRFYSGMPFDSLEHLFIFTTGDGPSVWDSGRVSRMLEAITGVPLEEVRQSTPRDVIFNCQSKQLLKLNGAISHEAWRAMAIREPIVIQRAQSKLCRTCVCSFPTEQNEVVALVLFYREPTVGLVETATATAENVTA